MSFRNFKFQQKRFSAKYLYVMPPQYHTLSLQAATVHYVVFVHYVLDPLYILRDMAPARSLTGGGGGLGGRAPGWTGTICV